MIDRRAFLASLPAFHPRVAADVISSLARFQGSPQDIASNEDYWFRAQQAFTVDRSVINLNSGGCSPAPLVVQEAMKRHLDYSNSMPVRAMWSYLEPQREGVRAGLARVFGCDPEEIAITRNSSEALQILQAGIDLKSGDEVLANNQDYPRMLNTYRQRERREGIVLKTFPIPVPCDKPADLVALYEKNITAKTKQILVSHVINLTGQVMPVKEICALGRAKGIPVIVDGAHAFANLAFTNADLDCDYYATSLHKWLFAPIGTGLLFVRKDKIKSVWPLQAAGKEQEDNIRKFEEIGTHPAANALAIAEALAFHHGLGPERKEARLRYLRARWIDRLTKNPRVKINSSLNAATSCGLGNFAVEGLDPGAIGNQLWDKHKIIVTPIGHDDVKGVRVTPSVWTTLQELDRFCDAVEGLIKNGMK